MGSRIAFLLAASMVVCQGCAQPEAKASVCEISADPTRFIGKPVVLSGLARMGRHDSSLTDKNCPDTLIVLKSDGNSKQTEGFFLGIAPTLAPLAGPLPVTVRGQLVRTARGGHVFLVKAGTIQSNTDG